LFSSGSLAATPSLLGELFSPGAEGHALAETDSGPAGHLTITVDISTQEMTVENDWGTVYTWDVSTGRSGHATPIGRFRPIRMHEIWYSSKYENAPMPWSIFFHGGYAIHGTTDIKHLGHVASHGCVRLDPRNAKVLYDLVKQVGMQNTTVMLIRS
ncbi:MAG TPA: L,D-transpeptidase, partial [Devosia sp.]|nr:L,D-transpeptidase [Devosia sp.]